MTRDRIVAAIKAHRSELSRRGVRPLALFGSAARDEARPDSDVDVMVDLDPVAKVDLFDLMDLRGYLADLLHSRVDLVVRDSLKPGLRERTLRDAVHVF